MKTLQEKLDFSHFAHLKKIGTLISCTFIGQTITRHSFLTFSLAIPFFKGPTYTHTSRSTRKTTGKPLGGNINQKKLRALISLNSIGQPFFLNHTIGQFKL
jgi:hypothetical protein